MPTMAAPVALAGGNGGGPALDNACVVASCDAATGGDRSPRQSSVHGTLDAPRGGLGRSGADVLRLVGVRDEPVLPCMPHQQCADTSTRAERYGAPAHSLDDVPVLSSVAEER
jgi:hypothetical protein